MRKIKSSISSHMLPVYPWSTGWFGCWAFRGKAVGLRQWQSFGSRTHRTCRTGSGNSSKRYDKYSEILVWWIYNGILANSCYYIITNNHFTIIYLLMYIFSHVSVFKFRIIFGMVHSPLVRPCFLSWKSTPYDAPRFWWPVPSTAHDSQPPFTPTSGGQKHIWKRSRDTWRTSLSHAHLGCKNSFWDQGCKTAQCICIEMA